MEFHFHGILLLRIFPEFYGEFVEASVSAFSTGGNLEETRRKSWRLLENIFKSWFSSIFQLMHFTHLEENVSPWRDLFTFILTFCYINNDFLFIFCKLHDKYKLPLDLTGKHERQQVRKKNSFQGYSFHGRSLVCVRKIVVSTAKNGNVSARAKKLTMTTLEKIRYQSSILVCVV